MPKSDENIHYLSAAFQVMFQEFPAMIWRSGQDRKCDYFNDAWLHFTGRSLEQELGDGWERGVHPEDLARCVQTYAESFDARLPFAMEYRLRHRSGGYHWIMDYGNLFLDRDGHFAGYIGSCYDIDDRKQSEDALRESEERYRRLVEQMGEGLATLDTSNIVTYANGRLLEMLDLTAAELVGRSFPEVLDHANRTKWLAQRDKVMQGLSLTYDLETARKDGTPTYLVVSGSPVFEPNGQIAGSIGTFTDITKRKWAENELFKSHELLRQLSAHMETTREDERLKISREVHDELGQAMTGLKFDVASIRQQVSFSPKVTARLNSMDDTITETIGAVQRIVAQLRPRLLDDLGLQAAIEWQASEFTRLTAIPARVQLCHSLTLLPELSISLIRILQEALTNIVRHAQATEVTIMLAHEEDSLVFIIADDGKGLSHQELLAGDSFGLMGMRERATLCGGTLGITSPPGQGVLVRFQMPLNKGEVVPC